MGLTTQKKLDCFGTANTSDCCLQCPDNEKCAVETIEKHRERKLLCVEGCVIEECIRKKCSAWNFGKCPDIREDKFWEDQK